MSANNGANMTKRYPDPSPPQGQLDLEPFVLVPRWVADAIDSVIAENALKAPSTCEYAPRRYGQDQLSCLKCGLLWDVDEPRPPCISTADKSENRK